MPPRQRRSVGRDPPATPPPPSPHGNADDAGRNTAPAATANTTSPTRRRGLSHRPHDEPPSSPATPQTERPSSPAASPSQTPPHPIARPLAHPRRGTGGRASPAAGAASSPRGVRPSGVALGGPPTGASNAEVEVRSWLAALRLGPDVTATSGGNDSSSGSGNVDGVTDDDVTEFLVGAHPREPAAGVDAEAAVRSYARASRAFVGAAAMLACGLVVGDVAVVRRAQDANAAADNEAKGDKRYVVVWPSPAITDNRILLSGPLRDSAGLELAARVQLFKADTLPQEAASLVLRPSVPDTAVLDDTLRMYAHEMLVGIRFVAHNGIVEMQYGGGPLQLVVDRVSPMWVPDIEGSVNAVNMASVGGLTKEFDTVRDLARQTLFNPDRFLRAGIRPPRGAILYGPPGTGKTLVARAVAAEVGARLFTIDGPEVISKYYGETEERLKAIFDEAALCAPSIIFIDEIDALCPSRDEASTDLERRIVACLLTLLDGAGAKSLTAQPADRIFVLSATNRPHVIDEALRRPGRFDHEINIGIPDPGARLDILSRLLATVPHRLSRADLKGIADAAHGFVGADLAAVCREAGMRVVRRAAAASADDAAAADDVAISPADMREALGRVRPSSMREVRASDEREEGKALMKLIVRTYYRSPALLSDFPSPPVKVMLEVPKVLWSDIGGNDDIKQKLKEAVEWPLRHPEAFQRFNIKPPKGVLLYGPPGCSKTLLAKALATESGLNFLAVKGPELFSKWVGDSEKAVREVFRKARAAAPAIIFFDEIDAIGVRRSADGGGGAADRVLSQLLAELDGVEPLVGVTVVAATNRPDALDAALLRPGRIDRLVRVHPPDLAARRAILRLWIGRGGRMACDADVDVEEIAEK
ncbi:spermatogenesis associated protein 5, partial [Cladochytrium tenue]